MEQNRIVSDDASNKSRGEENTPDAFPIHLQLHTVSTTNYQVRSKVPLHDEHYSFLLLEYLKNCNRK